MFDDLESKIEKNGEIMLLHKLNLLDDEKILVYMDMLEKIGTSMQIDLMNELNFLQQKI